MGRIAEQPAAEWKRMNTQELVDAAYKEALASLSNGASPSAAIVDEARRTALTFANNVKYGPGSNYIDHRLKHHPIESPRFAEALDRIGLKPGATVVDMGVNDGFE